MKKETESPKTEAVKRILSIARLIRKQGTPDEADEALEWEKRLEARLEEIKTVAA